MRCGFLPLSHSSLLRVAVSFLHAWRVSLTLPGGRCSLVWSSSWGVVAFSGL